MGGAGDGQSRCTLSERPGFGSPDRLDCQQRSWRVGWWHPEAVQQTWSLVRPGGRRASVGSSRQQYPRNLVSAERTEQLTLPVSAISGTSAVGCGPVPRHLC